MPLRAPPPPEVSGERVLPRERRQSGVRAEGVRVGWPTSDQHSLPGIQRPQPVGPESESTAPHHCSQGALCCPKLCPRGWRLRGEPSGAGLAARSSSGIGAMASAVPVGGRQAVALQTVRWRTKTRRSQAAKLFRAEPGHAWASAQRAMHRDATLWQGTWVRQSWKGFRCTCYTRTLDPFSLTSTHRAA